MSKLSQFMGGGGGAGGVMGGLQTTVTSTNITAETNTAVGINTLAGEVTVTMPSDPDIGDRVVFFDAALTWNINPATIKLNGDSVQGYEGESDTFKLHSKGGMIGLLFVGETGWIDTLRFDSRVFPTWYESVEGSGGYVIDVDDFMVGKEVVLLREFTTSGDYVVTKDGLYVISGCGGGGGVGSSGAFSAGRITEVKLNDSNLLSFRGAGGTSALKELTVFGGFRSIIKASSAPFISSSMETSGGFSDGELFGLPSFSARGASSTSSRAGESLSSSILLSLYSGQTLSIAIGSGGGASSRKGADGTLLIHGIMEA